MLESIHWRTTVRYVTALMVTVLIGTAASLYTPSAQAAGVYVGVGLPVPVVAPPVVAGVPVLPAYYPYASVPIWGYGYRGWGYPGWSYRGWGYHGYAHRGFVSRGPGYHRR
jgi:hypothetical protein